MRKLEHEAISVSKRMCTDCVTHFSFSPSSLFFFVILVRRQNEKNPLLFKLSIKINSSIRSLRCFRIFRNDKKFLLRIFCVNILIDFCPIFPSIVNAFPIVRIRFKFRLLIFLACYFNHDDGINHFFFVPSNCIYSLKWNPTLGHLFGTFFSINRTVYSFNRFFALIKRIHKTNTHCLV